MPDYQEQHKKRLSYMPWLYYSLKAKHREWAVPWQQALQDALCELESVEFGEDCFLSPDANLFAEPGRNIIVGNRTHIAANTFIHGPITLGSNVSVNQSCILDGGSAGITIGDDTRIAAGVKIFAFNHGMEAERLIREQPVTSKGINIGRDVWIGTNVCIADGVSIGDKAVIGMGTVITKDVPNGTKVSGTGTRVIDQDRKPTT